MTTMKQPANAICNQGFKNRIELRTQTQPLVAKHIGGTIRAQNDRSRTRRTDEVPFIVGCSHFSRKNTRFGAPASSPKHSPCNIHAAITMRFATSRGKPAPIYARGNIKWRQWSSHSNAICNQRFTLRIELRTQTQPLVAKHIGGTIRAQNDRSRTRRTDKVPFIVGCSHFSRKNTRFGAPASSPKHSPCNIHAAITMRSATTLHQGQVSIAHHPSRGQASIRSASTLHQGHVKSHTTLQGQVSIAHHPSRSSLNRTPPFKIKSQSRSTLQGQVSIRSATTLHQGHVKSHTTLQGQLSIARQGQVSIAHHPSRSSLNRAPPFKVKSQSHTTLQDQVSIAHHPSSSSLNRTPPFTPPFKVKCQSRTTLSQSRTTLQGQVSIAHHPSRSSVNRAPPFIISRLGILFVRTSEVLLHNFLWLYTVCLFIYTIFYETWKHSHWAQCASFPSWNLGKYWPAYLELLLLSKWLCSVVSWVSTLLMWVKQYWTTHWE